MWKKRWGCRKIELKNVFLLENIFLGNFIIIVIIIVLYCKMEPSQKPQTLDELKDAYLKSLTEQEYKAYEIALDHLKGIFYLEETNGFLEWKRKKGF